MLKSFAGLWLLVFGPLFFLLYPSDFNPIVRFNDHIEGKRLTEIYKGTMMVIEQQLVSIPVSQWQGKIQKLSQSFTFDLRLSESSDVTLNERQQTALLQGQIVFVNAEPEYLLKKMGNSDFILQLYTDYSEDEKIRSGATGTVHLLKQAFNQSSPTEWPALIQEYSSDFPFHLRIIKTTEMSLKDEEKEDIHAKSFFWRGDSSRQVSFYIPLKDGQYILIADLIPMSSVDLSVVVILVLVFILVLSVGMFLWVYPLWRDLNRLVAATSEFGQGNLASRAKVSKISVVATLSQAFNRMAGQTEELLHGQRTLTNAIAHDLRTPLYRLRFAFEMLSETNRHQAEEKYWSSIEKSIDDLDHLINQTLQLSRYSSDRQLMNFAEHDVMVLIRETCQQILQLYPDIDAQLNVNLETDRTRTIIDSVAIKRAVSNLLTNACKFAHSRVHIIFTYDRSSGDYLFEIGDDGPGIPEHDLERIFQPFEQLNNGRRDIASGHGLGLAIVRHIAGWHSGTVKAGRSALGGAMFVFRWPGQ